MLNNIDLNTTKLTNIKKWISLSVIFFMTFIIMFFAAITFFGILKEILDLFLKDNQIYKAFIVFAPLVLSLGLILLSLNRFLRKDIRYLVYENLELHDATEEIDLNKESDKSTTEKIRVAFNNAKEQLNLKDDVILIRSKEEIFNAFAISNLNGNAVVVFDGLAKSISQKELQAVIGHELGHIKNKDSLHKMIDFSIVYYVPYVQYATDVFATKLHNLFSGIPLLPLFTLPLVLASRIMFFILNLLNKILNFIRAFSSKQAEHLADYAGMISSPENSMIEALEVIKNIEDSQKSNESLLMRALAEHPATEKRIDYLKNLK